jgi:hypothetical protein
MVKTSWSDAPSQALRESGQKLSRIYFPNRYGLGTIHKAKVGAGKAINDARSTCNKGSEMLTYRFRAISCGLLALAFVTPASFAVDAPRGSAGSVSDQSAPLRVYPPGDMQGRRRWLSQLLQTKGEFTDHQVAEFRANIAAMSANEVQNVKYTDATIKQFKEEVARMHPDEVRQLLRSWQHDSVGDQKQASSDTARRKQEVDFAIQQQKNAENARNNQRKFAEKSIKESDQRVDSQRNTALKESQKAQQNYLRSRYYNPVRPGYWGSYYRSPYRPYYGPYR